MVDRPYARYHRLNSLLNKLERADTRLRKVRVLIAALSRERNGVLVRMRFHCPDRSPKPCYQCEWCSRVTEIERSMKNLNRRAVERFKDEEDALHLPG